MSRAPRVRSSPYVRPRIPGLFHPPDALRLVAPPDVGTRAAIAAHPSAEDACEQHRSDDHDQYPRHNYPFFPNDWPSEERPPGKLRSDARVPTPRIFFPHRGPRWNPDYRRASVDQGERAPRLSLLALARSLPALTGEDAR